jgi:hypothetical protein
MYQLGDSWDEGGQQRQIGICKLPNMPQQTRKDADVMPLTSRRRHYCVQALCLPTGRRVWQALSLQAYVVRTKWPPGSGTGVRIYRI